MYLYILVCTRTCRFIPNMFHYIAVHTSTYCYVLECTSIDKKNTEIIPYYVWTGLGGLTVTADETAMMKKTVREDQAKRSAETRRHRRADGA